MERFQEGEWVLITTQKGKDWLVLLTSEGIFSCHLGSIPHREILNKQEGDFIETPSRTKFFLFRPSLKDFLFHIKRKTQIIYPKDIGAIICYGDIRPGMKVLECGVGSGAMTLFLLTILGKEGYLVSLEKRLDFAKLARENIQRVFRGLPTNWYLIVSDIESPAVNVTFDRIVLDLPEPWKAVEAVKKLLKPGGILTSLSPQVTQIQILSRMLRKNGFRCLKTFEILKRDWLIDDSRARPTDRMVAHTGFLLFARRTTEEVEEENQPSDDLFLESTMESNP